VKRQIKFSIVILLLLVCFCAGAADRLPILIFYEQGCPQCDKLEYFFNTRVIGVYPVKIVKLEIHAGDNAKKLIQLAKSYGSKEIVKNGAPATFIADQAIQGGNEEEFRRIEEIVRANIYTDAVSPLKRMEELGEEAGGGLRQGLTLPALLGAAAVDAVNPCAFAVLTLMLGTLLVASKHKRTRRVLLSGMAFTVAVFICYVLMGFGLFGALEVAGLQQGVYLFAGILAIVVGGWNLKDAIIPNILPNIEVPKAWHGRIERISSAVTSPLGAFTAGCLVSWMLLPCTSGPYLVVLGMLGDTATHAEAVVLILIYNAIFVIPFIAITFALAFGIARPYQIENWRRKHKRTLHLATGIFMLLLGIVVLSLA